MVDIRLDDDMARESLEKQQRIALATKALKLDTQAIMETDTLTPEKAVELAVRFAAHNAEAGFYLADNEQNNPSLRDTYKEYRSFWEPALVNAIKGDYVELKKAIRSHADINQSDRSRENRGLNRFGIKLSEIAAAIPDKGDPATPPISPLWRDPDIVEAEDPGDTPQYFTYL